MVRVPQEKRERLKATMTRLIVSDSKQVLVRETLEQITGRVMFHFSVFACLCPTMLLL